MQVAGPINSKEEIRGFEQIAFLTELRKRLRGGRRARSVAVEWPLINLVPDE